MRAKIAWVTTSVAESEAAFHDSLEKSLSEFELAGPVELAKRENPSANERALTRASTAFFFDLKTAKNCNRAKDGSPFINIASPALQTAPTYEINGLPLLHLAL